MPNASLDHTHQDSHQGSSYRRIELITGESRRRRWTAEEKARILAESFEPGAKVSEVALRHGVNRGLLWTWRRHARKRTAGGGQTFVPVRVVEEPPSVTARLCPHWRRADNVKTNGYVASQARVFFLYKKAHPDLIEGRDTALGSIR